MSVSNVVDGQLSYSLLLINAPMPPHVYAILQEMAPASQKPGHVTVIFNPVSGQG